MKLSVLSKQSRFEVIFRGLMLAILYEFGLKLLKVTVNVFKPLKELLLQSVMAASGRHLLFGAFHMVLE